MMHTPITLGLLVALLMQPMQAMAQEVKPSFDSCRTIVDQKASQEERELRAKWFGLLPAADAGISAVRFAKDGSAWIKYGKNAWRSASPGYEQTTWSDILMDEQEDVETRRGMYEAQRRLGTEFVPYVTQSMRTFQCRLDALCELISQSDSEAENTKQTATIKISGCVPVEMETVPECNFLHAGGTIRDKQQIITYCDEMKRALFDREADIAIAVGHYDAAWRVVAQLSGILQAFLGEIKGTILGSLRSATNLIGSLGRIPCFAASCSDGSPPPAP